jgi:succinyl-diaminopimelate desuccinylase
VDVLDLTAALVAIDSQNPGTGEAAIAAHVVDVTRKLGFEPRVVEAAPGRPNVLVEIDAGPGPALALCGHLDTKPIGDAAAQWETDPLALTVEGDLAYGLGSSDMKGPVAAMILAADRWAREARQGRLVLALTADEEAGSVCGAEALVAAGEIRADAMVIAEPSGIVEPWEAVFLASRGIACFEVTITSKQGHSALSPHLPTSATVAAAKLVIALAEFIPSHPEGHGYVAHPTVNPAVRVEGGVFYGVHPGEAVVASEVRTVPGMDRDVLEQELRALVAGALPPDVDWSLRPEPGRLGWMAPSIAEPRHPVVTAALDACEQVLGRRPPLAAYPGGTDATAFTHGAGIPCIASLGPGWLTCAHGPNEHIGVADLRAAVDLYADLAQRFCAGPFPTGGLRT